MTSSSVIQSSDMRMKASWINCEHFPFDSIGLHKNNQYIMDFSLYVSAWRVFYAELFYSQKSFGS